MTDIAEDSIILSFSKLILQQRNFFIKEYSRRNVGHEKCVKTFGGTFMRTRGYNECRYYKELRSLCLVVKKADEYPN